MNDINVKLAGLTCEACVKLATMRFKKLSGVESVKIDLASGDAKIFSLVEYTPDDLAKSLEGTQYSIVK
jgi:copper chaperone CopZ